MKSDADNLEKKIIFDRDKKSFEQLFFNYYDYLFGFAYRYLRNKEEAEEVVSDVFLSIWQKRESLSNVTNLKVYLYVMVKNHSLNHIKKHKRLAYFSIDNIPVDFVDGDENPERHLLTKELIKDFDEAIEGLPSRCKIIFQLVRVDGLRYKEVAEILDISVKTVENQVAIAIQKIGTKLAHHLHNKRNNRFIKWRTGVIVPAGLISFLF